MPGSLSSDSVCYHETTIRNDHDLGDGNSNDGNEGVCEKVDEG